MKVVFKVKTPKGRATQTETQIKKFIIGFNKVKLITYTNADDDEIFWEVEGQVKQVMNINKNLARFDFIMKQIFKQKMMKQFSKSNLSKEDLATLEDMLRNQTSVEVIKLDEQNKEDEKKEKFWEKIKRTYKKVIH